MSYYLAIDIGASSGRHILGWLEDGVLKTEEIYRFENGPKNVKANGNNSHLIWDHERLFSEILNGLKRAKEIGKIPVSVGIDTWGVDYVLLDENDHVINEVYCYRDYRTDETVEKVHAIEPFESLYEKTGIQFNTFNTVYQLFHDLKSGKMEKANTFLMLPDYFHFRLTGVKKQEYTNATTTGMVNGKTRAWDQEILSKLGYKSELFGELSSAGTVVGAFSNEVQEILGYNATVTLPATHDTASAVISAPLEGQTPYISSGTWSLLGVEQNFAHTDEQSRLAGYSNEGSVKNQFRLQMNIMGLWMIQQVRKELMEKGESYSFAEIAELAKNDPAQDEIDVNEKKYLAPKSMILAIEESVGRKLRVGEIAFIIYNNLAKYYARALEDLERITGETYQKLHIIGGGSKNNLLNELTKKYTQKQVITGPSEGTAIGNLIMQMIGAGICSSVKECREIVRKSFDIKEV